MYILRAMSNRPGALRTTLEYNCALSRYLLGDVLADHLNIPPTGWWTSLKLHLSLFIGRVPVYFTFYYPRRGWTDERREVIREGLIRFTRWNLGMRKTTFRPRKVYGAVSRTNVNWDKSESEKANDEGGELADGVAEEEKVEPDYEGGKRLGRAFRNVWLEMAGVLGVSAMICSMICWVVTWWVLAKL